MEISHTTHTLHSLLGVKHTKHQDAIEKNPSEPSQAHQEKSTETDNNLENKNKSDTQNNSDKSRSLSPEEQFTEEELKKIDELEKRDREVRAHEAAHLAAAGQHATGGPTFSYQHGPNGKRYAIGGEVGIDTSKVAGDPEATIQKAQQIRRAALAPAEPSSQDRLVAAQASQMEAEARTELQEQRIEETQKQTEDNRDQNDKESTKKNNATSEYAAVAEFDPDKKDKGFDLSA